ncbi:MAG: hypothetical protein IK114_04410 [Fibrobacter sp.]|nr:hypothetical protein [Fibrobacter sp.]
MRKYEFTRTGKILIFGANSMLAAVLLIQYLCMDYNIMQMFGTICVYMGLIVLSEIFIQGQMRNATFLATASIFCFPLALLLSVSVEFFVRMGFVVVAIVEVFVEMIFPIYLDLAFFDDFAHGCCQFLDDFSRLYCIVYCVSLPIVSACFDKMEALK